MLGGDFYGLFRYQRKSCRLYSTLNIEAMVTLVVV